MSALRICTTRTLLIGAVSMAILVATTSVSFASNVVSGAKYGAVICPDGNPCPATPVGSIDCTPAAGKTLPKACTTAVGADDKKGFNISDLPNVTCIFRTCSWSAAFFQSLRAALQMSFSDLQHKHVHTCARAITYGPANSGPWHVMLRELGSHERAELHASI